jgi:nucleoside-diphosphate-sugar epimerase
MRLALAPGSRVLVTGGAGFIGARVVRRLMADGWAVRVLDDLSTGRRGRLEGVKVELVVGDVRSERSIHEAFAGAAAVVHLAAITAPPGNAHEERLAHDVNVTGTLNVLAAAHAAGVARVVFASSASVYGARVPYLLHEDQAAQPTTAEGAQKLAAESYVRLFAARDGLPACVLRAFSVYGPGVDGRSEAAPFWARMVAQAAAGEPLSIPGDGTQTRDLVFVDDVAGAFAAALTTPGVVGRVLNLASGEAVAMRHLASLLAEIAGGLPPSRYVPTPRGAPQDVRASVAAVAAVLGWRARTKVRDGLRRCFEELRPPMRAASLAGTTAASRSTSAAAALPALPRVRARTVPPADLAPPRQPPAREQPARGQSAVAEPPRPRMGTGSEARAPTRPDPGLWQPRLREQERERAATAVGTPAPRLAPASPSAPAPLPAPPAPRTAPLPAPRAATLPAPRTAPVSAPTPGVAPLPAHRSASDSAAASLFGDRPPSWLIAEDRDAGESQRSIG